MEIVYAIAEQCVIRPVTERTRATSFEVVTPQVVPIF
jgi:hypothetical protein